MSGPAITGRSLITSSSSFVSWSLSLTIIKNKKLNKNEVKKARKENEGRVGREIRIRGEEDDRQVNRQED